jgi:microcystin degradation protein MlrC
MRAAFGGQLQIEFNGQRYRVLALDLGLGGAFIATDAPLCGGSQLKMLLRDANADTLVSSFARAIWGNGGGFGVQFIDPTAAFLQNLEALLATPAPVSVAEQTP